ncbi:nitroreductase family protein, partial [Bacillus sp. D-CC]
LVVSLFPIVIIKTGTTKTRPRGYRKPISEFVTYETF